MAKKTVKLLSIVGPTGSGKSDSALTAAVELVQTGKLRRVLLISADSRQVYQGLEITSGADIPTAFTPMQIKGITYPVIKHQNLEVYIAGVSIINPTQEWSVAHFQKLVKEMLAHFSAADDGIIMVGGTMLYHLVVDRPELIADPGPSTQLRQQANAMTIPQMHEWITSINKSALKKLNNSDKNNPRRLVRVLERLQPEQTYPQADKTILPIWEGFHLWGGILPDKTTIHDRISARVKARMSAGSLDEAMVLKGCVSDSVHSAKDFPAYTACGVREMISLLTGEIDYDTCVDAWTRSEIRYVKRQLTWWKKQQGICWFGTKGELASWIKEQFA